MLRSLLFDFNAYFATVEQQVNPRLRGRPVGVVPVMAESSCCIAVSYEARVFGIKTGTGVREARQRCPEITFIEARHDIYVEFHHRAVAAIDRIAPVRQVLSIDEMECELTGRWREPEAAIAIAHKMKLEVQKTVGEHLRSSIGIAPNTLLSKLASNMQKPDGLTVLLAKDLPQSLYHLKISDINGIGRRMQARLELAGITTIEALYAAPRDLLRTVWGGALGGEMYDKLRGMWSQVQHSETQSIGHSHVLPPQMRNPQDALNVLSRLLQKACMRLRKKEYYATGLALSVHYGQVYTHEKTQRGKREAKFSQTQDTAFLLHSLHTLWHTGLETRPNPCAVGLVLFGLVPSSQHTPSLFDEPPAPNKPTPRRAQLYAAMDSINKQYGKNALHFACTQDALDHAPMRIAFSQIPDSETER